MNKGEDWNLDGFALALADKQYQSTYNYTPNDGPPQAKYQPDPTFATHVRFQASDWAMKRMARNPELYGDLHIDVFKCNDLLSKNHGHHVANVPRFQGLHEHGKSLDAGVVYAGQSLHADLTGPMSPVGIGGVKYVLVVVDAWTRYVFAFPCKTKKEVDRKSVV